MPQNKSLFGKAACILLVVPLSYFSIRATDKNQPIKPADHLLTIEHTGVTDGKIAKTPVVCAHLTTAQLLKAFAPNDKSAILDVYPLKSGANADSKDFQLAVFFYKPDGKILDSTWKGNQKSFHKYESNYIQYLKENKISADAIPQSYQIVIEKEAVKANKGIKICLSLPQGNLGYAYLNKVTEHAPPPAEGKDSCCKCPPGCRINSYRATQKNYIIKKVYKAV